MASMRDRLAQFANSPQGRRAIRQLTERGQQLARDPRARAKIEEFRQMARDPRTRAKLDAKLDEFRQMARDPRTRAKMEEFRRRMQGGGTGRPR